MDTANRSLRRSAADQLDLGTFLGVPVGDLELEAADTLQSCGSGACGAGTCGCGGEGRADGTCSCRSGGPGAPDRDDPFEGLHPETVLSRRAFFWSLAKMMAAAGVVALSGSAVVRAMGVAARAQSSGVAAHLPRADAWVMVVDLAACTGCKQCMRACKTGHYLPADDHNWMEVWEEQGPRGTYHRPRPCMHCENAPCVPVCPVDATYHTRDGIVLVDNDRCIGCRACMAACPYDARYFWWDEPDNPAHLTRADYSPELTMPHRRGTVSKCVFCADYLHQSRLPRCVQQCPHDVLWFGEKTTDVVTNGVEVRKLSQLLAERGATRYKEEKGTSPRVYYLSPGKAGDHAVG
jgi:dimethyl sulfoxide reductase iron-sulfur subunit